jgi:hypothetical protein
MNYRYALSLQSSYVLIEFIQKTIQDKWIATNVTLRNYLAGNKSD